MAGFTSFQLKELDKLLNYGGYTPLIANSNNEFEIFFNRLGIDIYKDYDYSELNEEEYINNIMVSFCNALNEKIHTDGDIEVKLINYDFVNGIIDILITENFSYHFRNMTGSISSNRTVKF